MQQTADPFAGYPNLASLLGRPWIAKRSSDHPLSVLALALSAESSVERAQRSRAAVVLSSLDRAIQIVRPVMDRNGRTASFRGSLGTARGFASTVAELFAAARFAVMTTDVGTMVVDPAGGGPDSRFDLGGRHVFAEVYAPKSWRELNLADDIQGRFRREVLPYRYSLVVTRQTGRDDRLARKIEVRLRQLARRMDAEGAEVATFFGGESGDLQEMIGKIASIPEENLFVGWMHRDESHGGASMLAHQSPEHVSEELEAEQVLSRLDQLVPSATNVVVVDLGEKLFLELNERAYERATALAAGRRPELSAVLVTGRQYVLKSEPGLEFQPRSWYRVFPSQSATSPLSRDELVLLASPGLVVPGSVGSVRER